MAVLPYETGDSGWTDDLTAFHEEKAGADHFIDLASRKYALGQLERFTSAPAPVILEVGCSSGFLLRLLRERMPAAFLIGSDYVAGPLLHLAQEMSDIPLLQFDLSRCPLPEKSIDAVILLNVLEHIPDDAAAMAQVHRILKPGGIAIIEVPAGPHLFDIYDQLLMHCRRYSLASLKNLAQNATLRIISYSHLGCFLYPGFWWAKQHHKKFTSKEAFDKRQIVAQNISKTKNSRLLTALMHLEIALGKWISYPFGIRCLMTCRRVS
jgi:SAM-dependent methyltransferase